MNLAEIMKVLVQCPLKCIFLLSSRINYIRKHLLNHHLSLVHLLLVNVASVSTISATQNAMYHISHDLLHKFVNWIAKDLSKRNFMLKRVSKGNSRRVSLDQWHRTEGDLVFAVENWGRNYDFGR